MPPPVGVCQLSSDPGKRGFCLNWLEFCHGFATRPGAEYGKGVTLREVVAPVAELEKIFAATFTSDLMWCGLTWPFTFDFDFDFDFHIDFDFDFHFDVHIDFDFDFEFRIF